MALKFDEKTGSIMEPVITDRLKFVSAVGDIREATDEETLLYEEENIDATLSISNINIFIKNAIYDRTNPREYKLCPKCKKEQICVPIRHKSKIINVCTICEDSWI